MIKNRLVQTTGRAVNAHRGSQSSMAFDEADVEGRRLDAVELWIFRKYREDSRQREWPVWKHKDTLRKENNKEIFLGYEQGIRGDLSTAGKRGGQRYRKIYAYKNNLVGDLQGVTRPTDLTRRSKRKPKSDWHSAAVIIIIIQNCTFTAHGT